MAVCNKEEGHFDGASFSAGLAIIVIIFVVILSLTETDKRVRREAELPKKCSVGEQVLMTTAPTSELYVCESRWVRR